MTVLMAILFGLGRGLREGMVMHPAGVRLASGFWAYHALDLAVLVAAGWLAVELYERWAMAWLREHRRRLWVYALGVVMLVWEATEIGYTMERWGAPFMAYEHVVFADVVDFTLRGAGVYVLHVFRVAAAVVLMRRGTVK